MAPAYNFIASIDTSRFFRNIFENSNSAAIIIYDTKGKIIDANLGVEKSFGYTKQELIGKHFSLLFIETDLKRNLPEIELTTTLQRGSFKDNNYVLHRNGSPIWGNGESTKVESSDGGIFIVKIIHDINEQKLLEQHLSTLNDLNEDIIQSIAEPLSLLDENLLVQKANYSFCKFFKIQAETVVNRYFPQIAEKLWDNQNLKETLNKVLSESTIYEDVEVSLRYFDGSKKVINVNVRPINESRGGRNRILLVIRDITDEKASEIRREEFISYTSHELRTPITSIKAYIQLLERCIKDNKPCDIKTYLGKIHTYVNKLNYLISDLHDVSKAISGRVQLHKSEFNLQHFLQDVLEAVELANESHEIIMEGEANINIRADKYRLQQVLSNLLSNAVKYSPQAGKIIITVNVHNGEVIIGVKDFGIGIPKDRMDQLFKKFYRVERTKKVEGLGLGLFISKEIIQSHKGKIWVESEEGKGSTFFFSLPIQG